MPSSTPSPFRLIVRSRNPLVWVSGIRQGLRRRGAAAEEIRRFSDDALAAGSPEATREICASWAEIEIDPTEPLES